MTDHVRLIDIDAITPHPSNPKAHDVDTLVRSMLRFGFVEPIVVDQRTGLNVSGHGRVKALLALRDSGAAPPDGIVVEDGRWLAPVFAGWASADEPQAEAALVALNRIGEAGGWDDGALLDLLTRLSDVEDGLVAVGFDEDDITDLRALLADVDDLDGIADGYDPDAADNLPMLRLHVERPLLERWKAHAAGYDSDSDALEALLPDG